MRGSWLFVRLVGAITMALWLATPASAQLGRASGTVRDEAGRPLKGATVVAENDEAAPASFTAITGDKGQFTMLGLRSGLWTFTASAPGFFASRGSGRIRTVGANPSLAFTLTKAAAFGSSGVLAGVDPTEVHAALTHADALMADGRHDDAIAEYRALLARVPALTTITLQIGRAMRLKRDFDAAIALYRTALATAADVDERTTIELGATYVEKGDLAQAEATLGPLAAVASASRDACFGLAEVKLASGQTGEAVALFRRAAEADPSWVRPLLKLGLIAANQGDRNAAARYLERVVSLQPSSTEAAQARALLDQVRR